MFQNIAMPESTRTSVSSMRDSSPMWSDSETSASDIASQRKKPVHDEWGTDHLPLGEDYISFTGLLDGGNRNLFSSYSDESKRLSPYSGESKRLSPCSDETSSSKQAEELVPQAGNCRAFGAGLHYGQVGIKNNFQVCIFFLLVRNTV